jgi:hypothetical protein
MASIIFMLGGAASVEEIFHSEGLNSLLCHLSQRHLPGDQVTKAGNHLWGLVKVAVKAEKATVSERKCRGCCKGAEVSSQLQT